MPDHLIEKKKNTPGSPLGKRQPLRAPIYVYLQEPRMREIARGSRGAMHLYMRYFKFSIEKITAGVFGIFSEMLRKRTRRRLSNDALAISMLFLLIKKARHSDGQYEAK